MTSTEILLTVLFSPVVLLFARVVRPREDIARSMLARAVGIIGLLLTAGAFWIELEASRTVLLILSALVVLLGALPVSEWSRTLLRIGLVQAPLLASLILLLKLGSALFTESYRATRAGISPDGRWEFRCPSEYDTNLSIAPRGLSTWDPAPIPPAS